MFGFTSKKDKQIESLVAQTQALVTQNQSLVQNVAERTAVTAIRGIEIGEGRFDADESISYYLNGVGINNQNLPFAELDSTTIDLIYRLVPIYAACVDGISREISNNQLSIVPAYKGAKGTLKEKKRIEELFLHPNVNWQSFSSYNYELTEDELNFGKSVTEKCFARDYPDILLELWSRPADKFEEVKSKNGVIIGYWQKVGADKNDWIHFEPQQIMMTQYNSRSKNHRGKPMMEGILSACNIIIKALDFIVRSYDYNEIPPGVLWIKGANQADLNTIRNKFLEKNKGGGVELLITMLGGNFELIQWITLKQSIKDMNMLEHINNAERIIYNRFGVSSDAMSDVADVNKASATVMRNIRSSTLINPITTIRENYFNEEIVFPHLSKDWKIKLIPQAEKNYSQIIEKGEKLIKIGVQSVNEVRNDLNLEPVDGGDEHIILNGARVIRVRDLPEGDLNPQLNPYQQGNSNNQTGVNGDEPPVKNKKQRLLNEYKNIWSDKKASFIHQIISSHLKGCNYNQDIGHAINHFYKKMELALLNLIDVYDRGKIKAYLNKLDIELLDNVRPDSKSFKSVIRNAIREYENKEVDDKNEFAMLLNNAYESIENRLKEFVDIV